jgi:hypothetical protein
MTARPYRVTILISTPPEVRGRETAFRRWVVLSDHEQRALAELERSYATGAE